MSYDYTNYPSASNLVEFAGIVAPTLSTSTWAASEVCELALASAAQTIEAQTGRQFTTVTENRYFDGSGTGAQVVDDYVSLSTDSNGLTEVYVYVLPGMTSGGQLQLGYVQQVTEKNRPSNIIQIYQGPVQASYIYYTEFPQGRSNVQVGATWGYGSTIPTDIFEATMALALDKIMSGARYSTQGLVTAMKDGDADVTFSNNPWWEASGWDKRFNAIIKSYKRDITTMLARRKVPQF